MYFKNPECPWCDTPMEEYAPRFTDGSFTREIDYQCENKKCTGPLLIGEQVVAYLNKKFKNKYHAMYCSSYIPPYEVWTNEVREHPTSTEYHKVSFTGETWKECVAKAAKYEQEVSDGALLRQSDGNSGKASSLREGNKRKGAVQTKHNRKNQA